MDILKKIFNNIVFKRIDIQTTIQESSSESKIDEEVQDLFVNSILKSNAESSDNAQALIKHRENNGFLYFCEIYETDTKSVCTALEKNNYLYVLLYNPLKNIYFIVMRDIDVKRICEFFSLESVTEKIPDDETEIERISVFDNEDDEEDNTDDDNENEKENKPEEKNEDSENNKEDNKPVEENVNDKKTEDEADDEEFNLADIFDIE